MGFFGKAIGFDQVRAQTNTLLAEHHFGSIWPENIKEHLVFSLFTRMLRGNQADLPMERVLGLLDEMPRGLQMQLIASMAMAAKIPSAVPGIAFWPFPEPFKLATYLDDASLIRTSSTIAMKPGPYIAWPGNAKRLDISQVVNGMIAREEKKQATAA